jgi:hypothetical protein
MRGEGSRARTLSRQGFLNAGGAGLATRIAAKITSTLTLFRSTGCCIVLKVGSRSCGHECDNTHLGDEQHFYMAFGRCALISASGRAFIIEDIMT